MTINRLDKLLHSVQNLIFQLVALEIQLREEPFMNVSHYLAKIGKKGGERKVPKGLARLPVEKRKAIAAKRLAARRKNARRKP